MRELAQRAPDRVCSSFLSQPSPLFNRHVTTPPSPAFARLRLKSKVVEFEYHMSLKRMLGLSTSLREFALIVAGGEGTHDSCYPAVTPAVHTVHFACLPHEISREHVLRSTY